MTKKKDTRQGDEIRGRGFTKYRTVKRESISLAEPITPATIEKIESLNEELTPPPISDEFVRIAKQAGEQLRASGLPGSCKVQWNPDNPNEFEEAGPGHQHRTGWSAGWIDKFIIGALDSDRDSNEGILARVITHATLADNEKLSTDLRIREAYMLGRAITELKLYKFSEVSGSNRGENPNNRGSRWQAEFSTRAKNLITLSMTNQQAWNAIPIEIDDGDYDKYDLWRTKDGKSVYLPVIDETRSRITFEQNWKKWIGKSE